MFVAISILVIIICVLLVLIVLVQNSKGGGLASGISGTQVMGVRKTADFLEKATWTLAGSLIVLCVVANIVIPRGGEEKKKSMLQEEMQNTVDPSAAPNFPTTAPQSTPVQPQQPAAPAK